jgi:hypothetical protein
LPTTGVTIYFSLTARQARPNDVAASLLRTGFAAPAPTRPLTRAPPGDRSAAERGWRGGPASQRVCPWALHHTVTVASVPPDDRVRHRQPNALDPTLRATTSRVCAWAVPKSLIVWPPELQHLAPAEASYSKEIDFRALPPRIIAVWLPGSCRARLICCELYPAEFHGHAGAHWPELGYRLLSATEGFWHAQAPSSLPCRCQPRGWWRQG